jgi:hypothetical protein
MFATEERERMRARKKKAHLGIVLAVVAERNRSGGSIEL